MKPLSKLLTRSFLRMRGWCDTTILGEPFRCNVEHVSFWKRVREGRWEPRTFRILDEFLTAESIYWDVGAWIGPTVLYASRRCGQAYCFEPDPRAFEHLLANLRLNQVTNVVPFHLALTESDGLLRMAGNTGQLGDSTTSSLHAEREAATILTPGVSLKTLRSMLPKGRVDFIKMDVEGGEFTLMPTLLDFLRKEQPILYLSTHAPYLPAEERSRRMAELAELFTIYPRCLDESGQSVSASALVRPDAVETFTSFLFLP